MMFTENSALVKLWVRNIKTGRFTVEQVPNIGNLKDVVISVLDSQEE